MISDKIAQSIMRWLFETSIDKGPLRKVALVTSLGGEVCDWPIDKDPSGTNILELVSQILEYAQVLADSSPVRQMYSVVGYFGNDREFASRTVTFPIANSKTRSSFALLPTDPSSPLDDGYHLCDSNETRQDPEGGRYCHGRHPQGQYPSGYHEACSSTEESGSRRSTQS